jgi:peptidoglycan/xylan/chitin deacetylase (PgdA/CDA1 family)
MRTLRLWAVLGALFLVAAVVVPPLDREPLRPRTHRTRRSPRRRQTARALVLPARLPDRHVVLPVLVYHRIDRPNPHLPAITQRLTVAPGAFTREMTWLKRHGFHTVTQRQVYAALVGGRALAPKAVLVTFDDGYRDVFGKASPVLRRLHLHATAYVITGRISGSDPSFLTWPQLRALEHRGIEIGSHSVSHVDLRALPRAALRRELVASRRALERALGHPVQWFAYPYGDYDRRVVAETRRAGYVVAATEDPGTCETAARILELQRLRVLDTTTLGEFAGMLEHAACE